VLKPADVAAKAGVEETRLRILKATRETYAERGSRGTTTRDVADRAGVNEATLFRHFGTKGQLLSAMLDHFSAATAIPALLDEARTAGSIEAQLRHLGAGAIEQLKRKEDLIKVSMAEEFTNPEGSACAWQAQAAARSALTGYMQEKVKAGELRGNPEMLARVFMSLFFAYVMARKLWTKPDVSPDQAIATMVDIFLNGARAT
jgi:AcrR family transcriptional regulator